MRSRLHLEPSTVFDVGLAAAFGVVAIAVFLASGRPHAVLSAAHAMGSRIGWRAGYETGLLVGLGLIVLASVAAIAIVAIAGRRRGHPRRVRPGR